MIASISYFGPMEIQAVVISQSTFEFTPQKAFLSRKVTNQLFFWILGNGLKFVVEFQNPRILPQCVRFT